MGIDILFSALGALAGILAILSVASLQSSWQEQKKINAIRKAIKKDLRDEL